MQGALTGPTLTATPNGTAAAGSGGSAAAGTSGIAASGQKAGTGAAVSTTGGASRRTTTNGVTPQSNGGLIAANAPGVTDKYIYYGVPYSSSAGAADRAAGVAGAAPSYDTRAVNDAVVKYANAHGGFAGRQLVPIYFDYNATTNHDVQDQSACATWTQDHKVFALDAADSTILDSCAEKAGAIPIGGGPLTSYQRFPHLIAPAEIRLDRLGTVTVNGLARAHYFTGKLGLVTWDDPAYHYTIDHGYLPALAAHGVKVWQTAYISVPQSFGAISDSSAAVSSAITHFRSLGIDHVIIQDGQIGVFSGGGLTLQWMDESDAQHYYPRYGQNADNFPGETELPADQQNDALAINDVDSDPSFDVGWHQNTARQLCFKIEADAGMPVSSSNSNDETIAEAVCDLVFFIQKVVNGVSLIDTDNFIQTAQNLGTSFKSALIYGTKLIPGRRDGGDMFRTEEYFSNCQCLKFQGQPYWAD